MGLERFVTRHHLERAATVELQTTKTNVPSTVVLPTIAKSKHVTKTYIATTKLENVYLKGRPARVDASRTPTALKENAVPLYVVGMEGALSEHSKGERA